MKNVMSNNNLKIVFLTVIICFLLFGGIGVVALTLYADDIIYNPTNSEFTVDNAQSALDELYQLVDESSVGDIRIRQIIVKVTWDGEGANNSNFAVGSSSVQIDTLRKKNITIGSVSTGSGSVKMTQYDSSGTSISSTSISSNKTIELDSETEYIQFSLNPATAGNKDGLSRNRTASIKNIVIS